MLKQIAVFFLKKTSVKIPNKPRKFDKSGRYSMKDED